MNRTAQTRQNTIFVAILCAAGAAAWTLQLRAPLAVEAQLLDALPHELASWVGEDVPLDETVERMLRADHNVQRAYIDPAGGRVWLYVGYYGTERGGRSEHSPFVCYRAAGWTVQTEATQSIHVPGGGEVRELRVVRDGRERLVHFWYRSHRTAHLVGEAAHAWDRFVGRIAGGRADGAFIRISAPLSGVTEDSVRARLFAFGVALDAELGRHWPHEATVGSQVARSSQGHRSRLELKTKTNASNS